MGLDSTPGNTLIRSSIWSSDISLEIDTHDGHRHSVLGSPSPKLRLLVVTEFLVVYLLGLVVSYMAIGIDEKSSPRAITQYVHALDALDINRLQGTSLSTFDRSYHQPLGLQIEAHPP